MNYRRWLSIGGPFLLALSPLLVSAAVRMVPSGTDTPIWPAGVVELTTDASGVVLNEAQVLDPSKRELVSYPPDLVVTPPEHGEVRLLTLFATGRITEIQTGLSILLGFPVDFYVVRDGFGEVTRTNLGANEQEAISMLDSITPVKAEVRVTRRPDGSYSDLLVGTSLSGTPGSLPRIDPSRIFVVIAFGEDAKADAVTYTNELAQAGFTNVQREQVVVQEAAGAVFQYRLDPSLAEIVAAAVGADVRVEPITDLDLADGADVLIMLS